MLRSVPFCSRRRLASLSVAWRRLASLGVACRRVSSLGVAFIPNSIEIDVLLLSIISSKIPASETYLIGSGYLLGFFLT